MRARTFWLATTHALLFTGLTTAGSVVMTWAESSLERQSRAHEWLAPADESEAPALGRTLGRLEIQRLRIASLVVQGDDDKSLLVGVGHLPDTVLPWEDGNSVLAGHRDTDFRPLKDIRAGDVIRFQTATVTYDYVVRDTSIVEPTDLTPLRATQEPTLTLITCYPFGYVGAAPSRFIVQAEREATERHFARGHHVCDNLHGAVSPQQLTSTRRKVAGNVAPCVLVFWALNRASSSVCRLSARPSFSAAANAFIVGP